jgi:hypothetical protein
VTWLLVLQGFLFTAFVNGVGLYEKFKTSHYSRTCITLGLILIGLVGIISAIIARNVTEIAFRQMNHAKRWWKDTGLIDKLPPVAGDLPETWFYYLFSTGRMPFVLVGVWVALIVLLMIGVWRP